MTSVVVSVIAHLRARRGSAVGLALLVFVAAVVPLAAATGARQAGTSLDRMRDELEPYHADLQFEGVDEPPADALERLERLPSVEVAGEGASIPARPAGTDLQPMIDSFGHGALSSKVGTDFERARLEAGRMPGSADEVMLSLRMARRLGLDVGDTFSLETFTFDGLFALFEGTATEPDGPTLALEIVGIGQQAEELTAADAPAPSFVVDRSFLERWGNQVAHFPGVFLVRLRDGMGALDALRSEARGEFGDAIAVNASEEQARVDDAIAFQAASLWLLAGVSGLAGLAAIAQAAVRSVRAGAADRRVLAALGQGERRLLLTALGTVAVPAMVGLVGAHLSAFGASGWLVAAPAERIDPLTGLRLDGLVVAAGSLLLLLLVVGAVAKGVRPPRAGPSTGRLGERVAATSVLTPALAAGVRAALSPSAHSGGGPVWSTFVAVTAAIVGMAAVLTFGESLARLVDEPARHGWPWDLQVALGDELDRSSARDAALALADDPRIAEATLARVDTMSLDGRATTVWATERLAGSIELSVVAGRSPAGPREIALGGTTLDELDVEVGDVITTPALDGAAVELEIVGQITVPTSETDDPAEGAAMMLEGLAALKNPDSGYPDLYVDVAPGVDPAVLAADLADEVVFVTGPVAPPVVSNLDLIDGTPRALALYLGALGIAASAHGLLSSLRARRGEIAVLRSLGFVRRQVKLTVHAHGSLYAAAGLVVGLPLGVAAGRTVWRALAEQLGFAGDPATTTAVLMLVPAALGAMAVIAHLPARRAGRVRPALVLRAE